MLIEVRELEAHPVDFDEEIEPAEGGGPAKVDAAGAGGEQEIGEVAINSHMVPAFFSITF